MECHNSTLCYLEQDGLSLPDTVGEDADRICLSKLDPQ